MAATSNTFEGLSNGTGITSGNSGGASGDAFDLMTLGSGATATADTSKSAHGAVSMKLATGVSAADCVAEWTTKIGSQTVNYGRAYLWIGSNPGTNHRLFDLVASPNLCGAIYLTTTGKLQPVDTGGGQMTITTNSIPLSQWFRIEWKFTASTTVGQAEVRLYNTADSGTATEIVTSAASFNTQASFNEYRFGAAGDPMPANRTVWYDDIGLSTVDFLGPVSSAAPIRPAQPGRTWLRRFRHRQTLSIPAAPGAVTTLADAALTVTETGTASLTSDKPLTATLTGTATGTAGITSAKSADASLTATATITASLTTTKPVDAALTATATETASITSSKSADATLTVTATLTADATVTPAGKTIDGALTVTATGTATGTSTKPVDAAQTVTAAATGTATATKPVDAALTATATGTASQTATKPIAAALAATATITASGTVTGANVVQADAALTATANRTATLTATKPADASLAVTAAITASGTVTGPVVAGTANAADGAVPTAITATGAAAAASSSAQAAAAAVSASMTVPTATGA